MGTKTCFEKEAIGNLQINGLLLCYQQIRKVMWMEIGKCVGVDNYR